MRASSEEYDEPAHAAAVCPNFARAHGVSDHSIMRKERRRRRAKSITLALTYQLDDCCKDGNIQAMVLADGDGLQLAAAGDSYACDEVAARMVLVGPRIRSFDGTLLGDGHRWDVQMTKVAVDGSELLVCAVGGTPNQRKRQIARGAAGALRILAA
jgi:hypothetical protein